MFLTSLFRKKRRIFFDAASGIPECASSARARLKVESFFGNPSSQHSEGLEAKKILEKARTLVARTLGVKESGVIFTSGGTESVNLAVRGLALSQKSKGIKPIISVWEGEHPAIVESSNFSKRESGAEVNLIQTSDDMPTVDSYKNSTIVVVSRVNGESGVISDTRRIRQELDKDTVLVVDATQSATIENISPHRLGADMLILDGSKIGGPRGVGCLIICGNLELEPILVGGGQERGLRAGSESPALAIGFATALNEVQDNAKKNSEKLASLVEKFWIGINKIFPEAKRNVMDSRSAPNILSIFFPNLDAIYAVSVLDSLGIACSASSACRSKERKTSPAIKKAFSKSSLRFSFYSENTERDVKKALKVLPQAINLAGEHTSLWQ